MRKHFSNYIERLADTCDDIVFVTGDLGYNALENLRAKMGGRFVNAGVAEQSMISIAAGMASQGYRVVCYSIAPFVVYRCLEQIRNDACFHDLPVYIVGNGGGYGYGVLGSSHHALEDIATLSGLPNMRCFIPAFIEDMNACLDEMFASKSPAYLRLGPGKNIPADMSLTGFGTAASKTGNAALTVVAQCPVTNNVIAALNDNAHAGKVELYTINKMPLVALPPEILASIARTKNVITVEEHVVVGGLGSAVSYLISEAALPVDKFVSLHAQGYPNGLYGNQSYHQQLSGLDAANISGVIDTFF